MRWALVGAVSAVALVTAGCGAGEVLRDGEWALEGMSPDGRQLLVAVPTGGCDRFDGWELSEDGDAVTVVARVWRDEGAGGCTSELIVDTLDVDLDEPLGGRELRGCGRDDCLVGFEPFDRGLAFPGTVTAAGAVVAVERETGMDLYTVDGGLVASIGTSASGAVLGSDDGLIVRPTDGSFSTSTAYEGASGDVRWVASGWPVAAGNADLVYLCHGEENSGLVGVDRSTGAVRWESDLPCTAAVVGENLVAVIPDQSVDAGHRLAVAAAESGEVLFDTSIFDGVADGVAGFGAAFRWGNRAVLAGVQVDLVVLAADGVEVDRWPGPVGWPLGVADDVLVVIEIGEGLAGYDLVSAERRWRVPGDGHDGVLAFDGGSAWALSADGRSVQKIAPADGRVVWEASIGSASGIDVAVAGDVAVVSTPRSLVGLDDSTGELLWSVDR